MTIFQRLFEPDEQRRLRRAFETLNDFAKIVGSLERSCSNDMAIKFPLYLLYDSCKPVHRDLMVIRRELATAGGPRPSSNASSAT